ncbi:MAG: protein kinase, partial [Myxococcales bacterium]|nr:protein kinase [Myxococcales bacterium]
MISLALFGFVATVVAQTFTNPCTSPDAQLANSSSYVVGSLSKRGTFGTNSAAFDGHLRLVDNVLAVQEFACNPPCAWPIEFNFAVPMLVTSIYTIDDGAGVLNVTKKLADSDALWATQFTESVACCGQPNAFTLQRRGGIGPFLPFLAKRVQIGLTSVVSNEWMDVIELFVCGRIDTTATVAAAATTTTTVLITTTTRSKTATTLTAPATAPAPTTTTTAPTVPMTTVNAAPSGNPATPTSSSTLTLPTIATTSARSNATRLTSASDPTSVGTTTVAEVHSLSLLSPGTVTIIAVVAGSVGGLLLVGGIVACVVVVHKKKQGRQLETKMLASWQAAPEAAPSMYEPAAEASSLRRGDKAQDESTYEPAAHASSLRRNQPAEEDDESDKRYDDVDNKKSAKDDAYDGEEKKKPKKKGKSRTDDEPKISQGSLPRTSKRTADGALHIPLDEIELGKKLGEGAFGIVYKGKWHGKHVAVKQVKASVLGGDKAVADFEVEVASMAKITFHENL